MEANGENVNEADVGGETMERVAYLSRSVGRL